MNEVKEVKVTSNITGSKIAPNRNLLSGIEEEREGER